MKLLVILENHLYYNEKGEFFADRVINDDYLKRYLQVFDEIILCARTNNTSKNFERPISMKNVSILPIPDFRGAKSFVKKYCEIKKIINEGLKQADAVIYRAPTHLSIFTYKLALRKNIPVAIEFMMAADKMIEGKTIISFLMNKIIVKLTKKMCMKVNGVSYVTQSILQEKYPSYATLYGETPTHFTGSYSSIDLTENDFYKRCKTKKKSVVKLINVSYMDSLRKGQDILLKALKIVKDLGYDVNLTLVGDGAKRNYFENLSRQLEIDEFVKFTGAISNKETKNELLKESDIFIMPTKSEGLPRTIIEAMALSLPCIATNVDGIPELLEDFYMVRENTPVDFANKIIECINNYEKTVENGISNHHKSLYYKYENLNSNRILFYKRLADLVSLRKSDEYDKNIR